MEVTTELPMSYAIAPLAVAMFAWIALLAHDAIQRDRASAATLLAVQALLTKVS